MYKLCIVLASVFLVSFAPENNYESPDAVIHQVLIIQPAKNLFGQPAVPASCMVKEIIWDATKEKTSFFYNKNKQLIKLVETDGNQVTNIEYNDKGQISRVTGGEMAKEMNLVYDQDGKVSEVNVKKDGGSEKVFIKYNGDKVIKVEYATFSNTYFFDSDYDLIKVVCESKDAGNAGVKLDAVIEKDNKKNYLLGTGDFRFISLLYGDYLGEGGYTTAGTNFYKKYTSSDNSTGVLKTDGYETEVKASNRNNYPTAVLFKFNDVNENYGINIQYDCLD